MLLPVATIGKLSRFVTAPRTGQTRVAHTHLSIAFKRRPEHVQRDRNQPRVFGFVVLAIGHADPDHSRLPTPRSDHSAEKSGLDHTAGMFHTATAFIVVVCDMKK